MAFNFGALLLNLVISVVLTVVSYLLTPKPKQPKTEVRDLELPTASAGRPIPLVFGTVRIKSGNILWFGEKTTKEYKVKA